MKAQNYENHVRYYPPHHFVFYPVALILLGISIYYTIKSDEQTLIWLFISVVIFLIIWVSFMLRQHYALMNQDRIVRMEMRFRYYVLTGQRLETIENQLSFGQILALRFASDEELPVLTQRALSENLSPKAIKKSIVNWLPDDRRV
ncbi:DUF6526 family protein [Larkinella rosea]|uniref:Uncharacterized protein n=1 Tax=Larkinella rosea TaxID=2025312 RepID=A0A3P1BNB0_9BACT|nr:DUF6526 family protein [Larkinella rosea]RRB02562.1 hypothetical protein EHT25_19105 [Larkinella rosea]